MSARTAVRVSTLKPADGSSTSSTVGWPASARASSSGELSALATSTTFSALTNPPLGAISPERTRSSTLLPEPRGPISPWTWPGPTAMLTPDNAAR